jgi:hypothetical protein
VTTTYTALAAGFARLERQLNQARLQHLLLKVSPQNPVYEQVEKASALVHSRTYCHVAVSDMIDDITARLERQS